MAKERTVSRRKKVIIICCVAALALAGAAGAIVTYVLPEKTPEQSLGMYGSNKSYSYYTPDYELDVSTVPEYMALDRNIYCTEGGETLIVNETDADEAESFFIYYFDCVINGRNSEYNELFTENYYKTNDRHTRFAPQMIYDIQLERLGQSTDDGTTLYNFNVSYKIYKNNGTFRNDIGSNGSKKLFFTLIEEGGDLKIDRITYYK